MDYNGLHEMHGNVVQKMNIGDFEGALELTNEIKNLGSNYYISYIVSGLLIDIGAVLGENLIREGIDLLEKDLKEMINKRVDAQSVYYNLANGYYAYSKAKSRKNPTYIFFKNSELDLSLKYYRKSLINGSPSSEIYINIGNCFDQMGRVIDALDSYQKALDLNPNHPLALGNKAIALCNYARLSGEHERTFLIEAYNLLSKSLEFKNNPEAGNVFSEYLKKIKLNFPNEEYLDNSKFPGCKIESKSELEKYLIEYCLKNKLYLNICNFCQKCDASIGDTAHIKQMTINKIEDDLLKDPFLSLSAYLNQIKQDYVTARFLLIISRYKKLNFNLVDKGVKIINTLDYSQYNVYIQFLKFAFKNIYDILDKIAYFLNEYLDLGFKERQIDFRKIWYDDWRKKLIHKKIQNTENISLNALFKIHQDLEESHKILKDIRNGITHRFIRIRMFGEDDKDDKNMTEESLVEYTLELALIVRNAIIYLLQFVNTEEFKKIKEIEDDGFAMSRLIAEDIPDNLKSDRHY